MKELKFADSLMPITRMIVTRMIPRKPNKLNVEVVVGRVDESMPSTASFLAIPASRSQCP